MIKQVMSKNNRLFILAQEDYTKFPGNGKLSKKINKCAVCAFINTGMNQSIPDFMVFLYSVNFYTFCSHESIQEVFGYITNNDKRHNEILDFLSAFSIELAMNNLNMADLYNKTVENLKVLVTQGINRINPKLSVQLDNANILKNNEFDWLITLLMLLKNESINIRYVLTDIIE